MQPRRSNLGSPVLALLTCALFSRCAADGRQPVSTGDAGRADQNTLRADTGAVAGDGAHDPRAGQTEASAAQAGPADAAPRGENGDVLEACAGVSAAARAQLLPTDVVWAIDTSGSLTLAFEAIQQALNVFSRKVIEAGVDAHVILLAGATGGVLSATGMCVPAPLGSGRCGGADLPAGAAPDSNQPRFLHLDTPFAANAGLHVVLDHHAAYKHLLRPGARTQLVLTEDGAPLGSAGDGAPVITTQAVIDHLEGRRSATSSAPFMPGLAPGSWTFNAVVCKDGFDFGSCLLAGEPPAATLELVARTGGVLADLNNAGVSEIDPFAELVDKLAQRVIVEARLGCVYEIPAPPAGMSFDPAEVNVLFSAAAAPPIAFPRLPDASACGQNEAWRYDQPSAPRQVELCPAACARVQRAAQARVEVEFGCQSAVLLL